MTDKELIEKILSYSIIYVDDCDSKEKINLNKILVKLSGVSDRLSEKYIMVTPAFYISDGYISYSSSKDYPTKYCSDEKDAILLFSEDIHLLDEIYEQNKNTIKSINEILSIDVNNRIRNKSEILKKRITYGK